MRIGKIVSVGNGGDGIRVEGGTFAAGQVISHGNGGAGLRVAKGAQVDIADLYTARNAAGGLVVDDDDRETLLAQLRSIDTRIENIERNLRGTSLGARLIEQFGVAAAVEFAKRLLGF
jgi:hypothetical protein